MFCNGLGRFGYGSYGYGVSGFGTSNFGISGLGGGILPLIMMGVQLLVFVAIIIFAVNMFKKYTNGSAGTGSGALKILDEKFARGEINEEEYFKKKTILSQRS